MSDLFISDEDAAQKLENPNNGVKFHVIGSGKGPKETFNHIETPELRSMIGFYAKLTSSRQAGEMFGTSAATANKASRGEVNHREVREEIKQAVDDKVLTTKSKALALVDKALGLASDDERLNDLTPMQQITMASQASGIIKNLTKEDVNVNMGRVTFNVVPVKTEEDYDEVDAIVVQENS